MRKNCSNITDWLLKANEGDIYECETIDIENFVIHNELRSRFDQVWTFQQEEKILIEKVSEARRRELEFLQPTEIISSYLCDLKNFKI